MVVLGSTAAGWFALPVSDAAANTFILAMAAEESPDVIRVDEEDHFHGGRIREL